MVGSNEFIREKVNSAPPGSKWGIGTEISPANRLAINNPDKTIFCLYLVTCHCSTRYLAHPAYVFWMLDGLLDSKVNNEITVPDGIKLDSKTALDRVPSFRLTRLSFLLHFPYGPLNAVEVQLCLANHPASRLSSMM